LVRIGALKKDAKLGGLAMSIVRFTSDQLKKIYREVDLECAELARQQGPVSAAQMNLIAARIMEAARDKPPAVTQLLSVVGPHGT
jgi:hypothetical protein